MLARLPIAQLPKSLKIVGLVLIAVVVACAVKILAASLSFSGKHGFPPVPVGVVTVRNAEFTDKIDAIGTAHANESVTITAKVTETVRAVDFNDGDTVDAGAVLIELTNNEDTASLHAAQASLAGAQKDFDRASNLLKSGSGTQQLLDQSRSARDNAKAQVDAIAARLSDRVIRAPFAGILGLRQVSQGSLVQPGAVMTTLDDVSTIKLDFTVPETYLGALAVGLDIQAKSPAFPDRAFGGKILAVDTRIDPATRAVTVRAAIPNPDLFLRPGLLITVEVIRANVRSLAVPQRALVAEGEQVFVFRLNKDGATDKVEIKTDRRQNEMVQVTGGLTVGDIVVADGINRVRPGQKIQVVEKDGVAVAPAGRERPES